LDKRVAYTFAKDLSLMDIELYNLLGDYKWSESDDATPLLDKIDHTVALREKWGPDTLDGIVIDIEPYVSDRWGDEKITLMDNYVEIMKLAYQRANENNLKVIVAVPVWLDGHYVEYLNKLAIYSDELSVMNYNRNREYDNIIDEIILAKSLEKDITCIFEFQEIGKHDLEGHNTYNEVGVKAAIENFEAIYNKVGYKGLHFAYHYYAPVKDLLMDW